VSTTSCLQSPNANKKLQKGKWTGASGEPPLIECEILSLPAVINHLKTNVAAALSAIRNGSKFGGVNYTGKIIPTTRSGRSSRREWNWTPVPNFLIFVVNLALKQTVIPFEVCYVNAQGDPTGAPTYPRAFNPAIDNKPEPEPERLQKWTNMANTSTALNPLAP
jgi:hypothetical protein